MMKSLVILEETFKNEFSGPNWRKYTVESAIQLFEDKIKGQETVDTSLFMRRIKRCKDMPSLLAECTNFLLGRDDD